MFCWCLYVTSFLFPFWCCRRRKWWKLMANFQSVIPSWDLRRRENRKMLLSLLRSAYTISFCNFLWTLILVNMLNYTTQSVSHFWLLINACLLNMCIVVQVNMYAFWKLHYLVMQNWDSIDLLSQYLDFTLSHNARTVISFIIIVAAAVAWLLIND